MPNRSWIKNLLRGKRTDKPVGSRPGDALFLVPRVRCLEDRRVLAVDTVVAGTEVLDAVEGSVVSLSGATFTDSTGDGNQPHTAEIDWGDGNVSQGIVTAPTDSAPGMVEGQHTYADNGSYTVRVTVTGADLVSLDDTTTFNILNDSPSNVALQLSAPTVDENGSVTLEGTFTDAGTLDEHTIEIDWGDGNPPEQFVIPIGERSFSATHQYLNDGGSNAPSDVYQISATVTDNDGDYGSGDTSVTVDNVAPTNVAIDLMPTAINENGQVTLQGTFDDPGTLDEHTIEIDWGDGSPLEQFVIPVGDRGFSATHTYLDDGPKGADTHLFSVTAKVIDSDGGWSSGTADVTVNNVAPSNLVLAVSPGTVDEPGLVTLDGSFDDPGTDDAFTVQIDWGDGQSDTLYLGPGETTFQIQHTYDDDIPSGTPYDLYEISVTVEDNDTGSITETTSVQVNNLPPTDLTLSLTSTSVDENGSVTLNGEFLQPNQLDTHTVEINWGDGSANTLLVLAAGETTFSASHTYADDEPNGTAFDTYTISATVTDDDTGMATASTTVDVYNVPPSSLSLNLSSPTIDENGSVTLSGSFSDDGSLDKHTVEIDWGDGSPLQVETLAVGERTFSFSHTYLDDAPSGTSADTYTIAVTVKDDDLGQTSVSTTVDVQNVAPQMVSLALDDLVIDENGVAWLNGEFLDPGTLDEYELEIDWGDGSPPTTVLLGTGERTFRLSHQYLDDNPTGTVFDDYVINLTLTDDDGGVATDSVIATVKNVAPQITSLTITPVSEDQIATLTGTYSDTGTLDTHFVDIDWDGDGIFDELNLAVSGGTFSFTHLYADDDPTGNPSDTFNVIVRLHDDDTGTDQKIASQTVTNIAPVLANIVGDTINENGVATVSATISDPGTQDVFSVTVDWQDGMPADTITGLGLADSSGTVGGTGYTWTAATRELVLTHQYQDDGPSPGNGTASDIYTVALTVADDDLGSSNATATVVVNNVAPNLINIVGDTIDEHGTATITAVINDPGTKDVFSVAVDWQDGTPGDTITGLGLVDASGTIGSTNYTWIAATRELTLTHQYLDDGFFPGNGTASDIYTVTLNIADDDLGTNGNTATVVVNNVAPNLINIVGDTIDEHGVASVTAVISDAGTKDVFSVSVNWQDGTPAETINGLGLVDTSGMIGGTSYTWIAATRELILTHQYLDDGPFPGNGTASDAYTVTLNVTDDDLGTGNSTATVVVNNIAPNLIEIVGDTIDEHGIATVTAVISEPGTKDVFSVTVDWQDGTPADTITGLGLSDASGTVGGTGYTWNAATRDLTLTHQYLDDGPFLGNGTASDAYTVTLNVADDDLGTGDATATVVVNNVAPQLINIVGDTIDENGVATITTVVSDPGTKDVFSVTVDWQDGSAADTITGLGLVDATGMVGGTNYTWNAATRELTLTHQYLDDGPYPGNGTASDTYTVTLNVADDDLGTNDTTATVVVNNVAPNLINVVGDTIDENGVATITSVISDPGTKDVFSVTVDWQDGTPADTITGLGLVDASGTIGGTNYTWIAATRELILTHQYLDDGPYPGNGTASDTYTVTLNVADDDLGTSDSTATVVVNNVAPNLIEVVGSTIDEHDLATVTAVVSDPGTKDVFSVTVDWQDGTPADTIAGLGLTDASGTVGGTNYIWIAATRELTLTHQYLDDGPYPGNGTASDTYTVTLNVSDDDLGTSDTTATVVVNNVAPTLINIVGDEIDEDSVATVTAIISDPGTQDIFSVTVDWQDGTPSDTINNLGLSNSSGTVGGTTYTWNAATRELTLSHQYLDDGTFPGNGTPSDTYTVALTVSDDDLGTTGTTATVVVNNVIPSQIVFTATPNVINEMQSVTITGTFIDTGRQDQHTLMVDWGDGTPPEAITTFTSVNGMGTFTATHQYLDDNPSGSPADTNLIRVFVTDDDAGTGVGSTNITVNNIAPVINTISATQLNNTGGTTVTLTFSDVGVQDTYTIIIDWADGTAPQQVPLPAGSTSLVISHQYFAPPDPANPAEDIPILVTVQDDDLQSAAQLVLADVPGQHVFGAALNVPLQTEPIEFQVVSNVASTPIVVPPPLSNVRTFVGERTGNELVQGADRRVIVRTVSIEGEEANEAVLPETTLDDLPSLFRRLPDGRYRIYLRQDKLERLILDVNVRQGKSVDPADENDGTRDRPPTSQVDPSTEDLQSSRHGPRAVTHVQKTLNLYERTVSRRAEMPATNNEQPISSNDPTQPSLDLNEVDWSKAARLLRELRRRLPT